MIFNAEFRIAQDFLPCQMRKAESAQPNILVYNFVIQQCLLLLMSSDNLQIPWHVHLQP